MQTKRISRPVMIVLAVIAAFGAAAWIYQTMFGLGVTGMNNGTSWGLYIASFMFFVGLSAGGLIVASSASIFHVTEFKKVALPAVCVSTVCICCAGLLVILDLGGVARLFNLILSPNLISPLFWDICVITLYLVINLIYLYFMTSKKADKSKIAIVSRFALPIAILVHSVTAWIFGLQIAREGWHSAIMGPAVRRVRHGLRPGAAAHRARVAQQARHLRNVEEAVGHAGGTVGHLHRRRRLHGGAASF